MAGQRRAVPEQPEPEPELVVLRVTLALPPEVVRLPGPELAQAREDLRALAEAAVTEALARLALAAARQRTGFRAPAMELVELL
jgi:hypothetical protein